MLKKKCKTCPHRKDYNCRFCILDYEILDYPNIDIEKEKFACCDILLKDFITIDFVKVYRLSFYNDLEMNDKVLFYVTESQLTEIMKKEPHYELKQYLQKVGERIFKW